LVDRLVVPCYKQTIKNCGRSCDMEKVFRSGGAVYIQNAIAAAVEDGSREAVISGNWEMDAAVRIPGDFTLILENCHLRLADGTYCNIFVNEHHDTELGKTLAGRDRNISILGRGEAILDGGNYNGLSEKTQKKDGLPPIWKNNMILFTNVEGFYIANLHCRNQRWWALNFIYCAHGVVENIDFCACDIGVDENGNQYHGLKRDKYNEVLVKNADGVDLRQGCHSIVIRNITGFCEDDSVALTCLNGGMEQRFAVEGLSPELCHVTVQNVRTAAYCSNVRLLNQGGMILHDILVDGVEDMSEACPYLDYGIYGVNVGDIHMYGSRHSVSGETYNITLRNVKHGGVAAIRLAGVIDNLVTENITVPEIEQNFDARIQIPHGKETVEARAATQAILDQR